MKIAICSDIHLEFGDISLINDQAAEVLVLSGDICVAKDVMDKDDGAGLKVNGKSKNKSIHTFFQECCERFPQVIYIAGNHEHYHGDFLYTLSTLKERFGYLTNLHIMEREELKINDIVFLCGTLWTDMNKECPHTLHSIRGYMNDYKVIADSSSAKVEYKTPVYGRKEGGGYDFDNIVSWDILTRTAKFTPEKSVSEHKDMLKFISDIIGNATPDEKFVVVGHHSPSKLSIKPEYENDTIVNGAYSSDLSEFILDHPTIKLWTHGHTHHVFDYMIGSTRVVCNPRGYINYENRADEFELLTVVV